MYTCVYPAWCFLSFCSDVNSRNYTLSKALDILFYFFFQSVLSPGFSDFEMYINIFPTSQILSSAVSTLLISPFYFCYNVVALFLIHLSFSISSISFIGFLSLCLHYLSILILLSILYTRALSL